MAAAVGIAIAAAAVPAATVSAHEADERLLAQSQRCSQGARQAAPAAGAPERGRAGDGLAGPKVSDDPSYLAWLGRYNACMARQGYPPVRALTIYDGKTLE